jgi:hypothetical protein
MFLVHDGQFDLVYEEMCLTDKVLSYYTFRNRSYLHGKSDIFVYDYS